VPAGTPWQTLPGIPDSCQHENQECDLEDKADIDPRAVVKRSTAVQHHRNELGVVIGHPTVIQNISSNNDDAKNKTSAWAEEQKKNGKWV
jgi:hypothetical protein